MTTTKTKKAYPSTDNDEHSSIPRRKEDHVRSRCRVWCDGVFRWVLHNDDGDDDVDEVDEPKLSYVAGECGSARRYFWGV